RLLPEFSRDFLDDDRNFLLPARYNVTRAVREQLAGGGGSPVMTDSQLIREIKDGNVDLYSELMRRYQRKIMAFIFHMLKSSKLELLAEDLCSETFYKAYRSLHSFREMDASFSTWLYTIARNTVLSELRKSKTANVSLDEAGFEPVASPD